MRFNFKNYLALNEGKGIILSEELMKIINDEIVDKVCKAIIEAYQTQQKQFVATINVPDQYNVFYRKKQKKTFMDKILFRKNPDDIVFNECQVWVFPGDEKQNYRAYARNNRDESVKCVVVNAFSFVREFEMIKDGKVQNYDKKLLRYIVKSTLIHEFTHIVDPKLNKKGVYDNLLNNPNYKTDTSTGQVYNNVKYLLRPWEIDAFSAEFIPYTREHVNEFLRDMENKYAAREYDIVNQMISEKLKEYDKVIDSINKPIPDYKYFPMLQRYFTFETNDEKEKKLLEKAKKEIRSRIARRFSDAKEKILDFLKKHKDRL